MSDAILSMARQITVLQPARLEIGAGAISKLGVWAAGYRRIFVVAMAPTVGFVARIGLTGDVTTFTDIPPEPDLPAVNAVLAAARKFKPDLVIGLGGGSVMDVAKLVAVLWDSEQTVPDVVGVDKVAGRRVALAQVPTTSGTGSEAGIRSLVTNPETLAKMAIARHMLADIAVLDPELTCSVPAAVTAATGVDALAHCVEAFTNLKAHPLVDGYATMGIDLVGRYLARAVADGKDTEARAGMMLASYYGGICLGPVNTAGGHALAYPLGTRLKLPHGLANAIVFPHVLAFNAPVRQEKTERIMTALGYAGAGNEADVLGNAMRYCRDLGIEMRLSQHGARQSDLAQWADEAFAIKRLIDNNPRSLGVADIRDVYARAF